MDKNVPTLPIKLRRQSASIHPIDIEVNLIDCVKFPLFINVKDVGKRRKTTHNISASKDCSLVKNSRRLINKHKTVRRPCKSIIVERHNYDKRANAGAAPKSEKTKQVLKSIFQGAPNTHRTAEKHAGGNLPLTGASCTVALNAVPESGSNTSDSDGQANGRGPSAHGSSDDKSNDEYILPPIVPRVILQRECIELKTHHIVKHDVAELTNGELYIGSKNEFLTDSNKRLFVAEFYAKKSISLTALRNKAKMVVEREKVRKQPALKNDQADDNVPPSADSALPSVDSDLPPADSALPPADSALPSADGTLQSAVSALPSTDIALPSADIDPTPADDAPPPADSASPLADSASPLVDSAPASADTALPSADSALPPVDSVLPSASSTLPSAENDETVQQTDTAAEDNDVRHSVELTERLETTKRVEEAKPGDGAQSCPENIDEQTSNSSDNIIKQLTSIFENVDDYNENTDCVVLSKGVEDSNENLKPLIGKEPEEDEKESGVTVLKEGSQTSQTLKESATDSSAAVESCEQSENDKKINESDEKTQQNKEKHKPIEIEHKVESQTTDKESFKPVEKNSYKNGENEHLKDKERREKSVIGARAELKKDVARKELKVNHQKHKLQKENLKAVSKVGVKDCGKVGRYESRTENCGKKFVKRGDCVDGANKPVKEQPKVTVLSSVSISKQEKSQNSEITQKDDIEECVTRFVVTKIVEDKSSVEKSEGQKPDSRSSDNRQIFNEVLKLKSKDDANRNSSDTKQTSSEKKIKVTKGSVDERSYKKNDSSSRAHSTRKTRSSYAKIRVKSHESLMEPEEESGNDVDEIKTVVRQSVASNSAEFQELKRKRGRPPVQKTINSSPATPSKTLEKAPNKEENKRSKITPTSINVTTSHLHSKAEVAKISPKATRDQCRLCGCSGDTDYVPLFGERAYEMDLLGKIHKHLEVKICESDGLPRQVCDDCANNVVSWARFHLYCSQVDDVLKEAHVQGNNSKQRKTSDTKDCSVSTSAVISEVNGLGKEKPVAAESDGEDQIEKMLRAIHESEDESEQAIEEPRNESSAVSNVNDDCAPSDEDDMLVEYLDEEQDLIVEALSASKQKKRRRHPENGTAKKESATGAPKVIRVDRKLSDIEIKQLLNRLELQNKSTTKIMVLRVNPMQHFSTYDIDNIVKDLTEKRSEAQKKRTEENSTDGGLNSHYSEMAASYARFRLDSIKTSNEIYFKCLECRLYLPAEQIPAHSRAEHGKNVALCDICSLLLPYDSDENKQLTKQHNDLHAGGKSSSHPDVIANTCKIMENASAERARQIDFERESEQMRSDELLEMLGNRIDDKAIALKEEFVHDAQETDSGEPNPDRSAQHRYKCAYCSLTFGSTPLYRSHMATQHGGEQFKCATCSGVFGARDHLIAHIKNKHPKVVVDADENGYEADGTEYMCDTCGKIFVKEAVYLKHKESHVGDDSSEKPFECPHCAKICSTAAELREHTLGHSTYATFLCDRCGQAFRTFQSQRLHRRHCRSGPGGGATLACSQCDYTTPLSGKLRSHIRAAHPNLGVFVCADCDQDFHTARQLKLHRVQIHERNGGGGSATRGADTAYTCPLCDWQYQHEQNLQKHFDYHVEKGHVVCKVCQQPFQHEGDVLTIADVRAHKTRHSPAENAVFSRPYSPNSARTAPRRQSTSLQDGGESVDGTSAAVSLPPRMMCKDCGEAFSTPAEMRKHQRVHKPFYCEKCKSVSLNENTFRQHMDQHHERTHECPSCGKLFMTRSALQLHSRAHTTEAIHSCSVCQRKFVLATDCRRHERSCRESHGWPPQRSTLVATEGSSGGQQQHHAGRRTSRAARNASRKNAKQEYALMIAGEDNITYEYIDQSVQKSSDDSDQPRLIIDAVPLKQEADLIHLVLEEGDTTGTDLEGAIEIDESELVAFQEWQKVASLAGKKRKASAADSNSNTKRPKQFAVIEGDEAFEGNAHYVTENDSGTEYEQNSEIQYIISNGENGEAARFFISGETDGQVFEGASRVVGGDDGQYTVRVEQKALASNADMTVTLDDSQGPAEMDAENFQRYVLQTRNGQIIIPTDGEVGGQYIIPEVDEDGQPRVVVVGGMATDDAEEQNYIVQDFSGGDVLVHDDNSTQNYVFESDGNADASENVSYVLNVPGKDGVATVYLKSGSETLTEMDEFEDGDANEAAAGNQNYVIVNENMPDLN